MRGQQHTDHVDGDMPGVEEPRLSGDSGRDADVHGVADEAVQSLDRQGFGGRDRSRSSVADDREIPEGGVEIDSDPDTDNGEGRTFLGTRHGRGALSQAPRHITSHGSGHEHGENNRFGDGGNVNGHGHIIFVSGESRVNSAGCSKVENATEYRYNVCVRSV